jgi:hypothetical protein
MASFLASAVTVFAAQTLAAVGVCDADPGDDGPSERACIAAIAALGADTVVDDIFRDSTGKTGDALPVYGKLFNAYPGCPTANSRCSGTSDAGFPEGWSCVNDNTFAGVAKSVETLDWKWANPFRLLDAHSMQPDGCPTWTQVVANGSKEGYKPWEGLVFDLGGASNRVVLFPANDHGPQPCESIEYTVYLTNNPFSRDLIENPTTAGADPAKWNRARLSRIFLEGWKKVRPGVDPGLAYTIEADSFTSVWSLPCGITFRYVGVISGNDGKDLPACGFDSDDSELDAVAGLTESGAGICPDLDRDGFVDCACPGHPVQCDCNDAAPTIHPGAPETCADADLDCDGRRASCAAGLVCDQRECHATCGGELSLCPAGTGCVAVDAGLSLCRPTDCTAQSCPVGTACDTVSKTCRPSCTGVTCPVTQTCRAGLCVAPCASVACPPPTVCVAGVCQLRCDCFNQNTGCPGSLVCDRPLSACVAPACVGKTCPALQACAPSGVCQNPCELVTCPSTQRCDPAHGGCVSNCLGVTCAAGSSCDPATGACVETA